MQTPIRSIFAAVALLAAGLSLGAMLPQGAPAGAGAAPGPELARLVAMQGLWETQTALAGMPPTQGLAKLSIVGGHWLIEEFSSEFAGQPFAGHGITGYDSKRKSYINAWASSMDTALKVTDMKWDEELQALVAEAQSLDMGGGEQQMIRATRMPDPDTMIFTLTPAAPDSQPAMTITYKRSR